MQKKGCQKKGIFQAIKSLQKIKEYLSSNFVVIFSISFFVFYPVMNCSAMNSAKVGDKAIVLSGPRKITRACDTFIHTRLQSAFLPRGPEKLFSFPKAMFLGPKCYKFIVCSI